MSRPDTRSRTKNGPTISVEARQERVLELALQGRTIREIEAMMQGDGIPVKRSTIHEDLRKAKAARAAANTITLQDQLMKWDAVERKGWDDGDMLSVRESLKEKSKLLGLYAPDKHEVNIMPPVNLVVKK